MEELLVEAKAMLAQTKTFITSDGHDEIPVNDLNVTFWAREDLNRSLRILEIKTRQRYRAHNHLENGGSVDEIPKGLVELERCELQTAIKAVEASKSSFERAFTRARAREAVDEHHSANLITPISVGPPTAAGFLFKLIPASSREAITGDLEEEFTEILVPAFGKRGADCRYWWHAIVTCSRVASVEFASKLREWSGLSSTR